jgi:hypothetical protein
MRSPLGRQHKDSTSRMDSATSEHVHCIRALDAQWLAAAARRDLDGMMAIYAPDARELVPMFRPLPVTGDPGFYATLMEQMPRFAHDFDVQEITLRPTSAPVIGTPSRNLNQLGVISIQPNRDLQRRFV